MTPPHPHNLKSGIGNQKSRNQAIRNQLIKVAIRGVRLCRAGFTPKPKRNQRAGRSHRPAQAKFIHRREDRIHDHKEKLRKIRG